MKLVELVQDHAFQKTCQEIASNSNLKWLYVGFGVVVVSFIFIKKRVLAVTDRWWMKLFLRSMLAVVFFLELFVVAYVVLGSAMVDMVMALSKLEL